MTGIVNDCVISLKTSNEEIHSDVYTLTCPNYFTKPGYDGTPFKISSPTFEFANVTWCFQFCSSDSEIDSYKKFSVYILRLKYKKTHQRILYKITLLDANDEECKDFGGTFVFEKDIEKCLMWYFNYKSPSYDRRDTLTLIVHLIYDKLTKEVGNQAPHKQDLPVKFANNTKDCEISLKSSKKSISSDAYVLNVPNFFSLIELYGTPFEISTPAFAFANGTWLFQVHSSSSKEDRYKSFIVYISKLDSKQHKRKIFYIIKALFNNDTKYDLFGSECLFEEDDQKGRLVQFGNYSPSDAKNDTLTLIIHLFPYELLKAESYHASHMTVGNRDLDLLSLDFRKLFGSGINQDMTLRVAGKEFRVHRDILRARSDVFEPMLSHDMLEKNKGIVDIPDCDPEAMEQFLIYLYSGKVERLTQDNVSGLYYAADKYNMIFLKEQCSEYMKKNLSPSMLCDVIQLALNHNDNGLLKCATEYFANHISDVLPTVEWMSFMKSNSVAANELLIKALKK